jgi:hypothetical protein
LPSASRRNSTSPGRSRGRCQEAAGGVEGRQWTMANLALAPRASWSRTSESKSASRRQAHRSRPSAGREQQRRRSRRAGSREGISLGKMAEARAADRLPYVASATDTEVRRNHAAMPPATRCRESEGND